MDKRIFYLIIFLTFSPCILFSQDLDSINSPHYLELKDGKILYGKIKFTLSSMENILISYNDTLLLKLNDIKSIKNEAGFLSAYGKIIRQGSDYNIENMLLKRIKNGKLQVYTSFNPFQKNESISSYEYYSKDNGMIEKVSYDNLMESLKENPESISMLKRYNFFNQLSVKLLLIGLSTTLYGIITDRTESKYIQYFGITCSVGSIVSFFIKGNKLDDAINIYNQ